MKALVIAIGAAAAFAAAAAGYVGLSGGGRTVSKAPAAKAKGPVQGSSFSAPAVAAAPAPVAGTAMGTPAPVSAPPKGALPTGEEAESNAPEITKPEPVQVAAVAPAAAPEPAAAPAASAPAAGGYVPLDFNLLTSFKYQEPKPPLGSKPGTPPPTPIPNQIPPKVQELDGKTVELEGYMVPMEVTDEGVKTFILAKTQPQCCFGDVQAPNEWIDVKMQPDQTTEFLLDRPVKVAGKLEVGEKLEDGFLVSLYRMTADKVRD